MITRHVAAILAADVVGLPSLLTIVRIELVGITQDTLGCRSQRHLESAGLATGGPNASFAHPA